MRLLLAVTAIVLMSASGALADPVEIKVQKRVLEKQERLRRPRLQAEEQTTVLTIGVSNRTGKDLRNVHVEWTTVVARGGAKSDLLTTGEGTLANVANTKTGSVETEAFPVVKTRAGKQAVEYRVIVKIDGKEVARTVSSPGFDALAAAAEPAKKAGKKKKGGTE